MADIFDKEDEILEEDIDSTLDQDSQSAIEAVMKKTEMSNEELIYIEDEIKASYLDYSMSVIVSRALPDVRDGLKPVHRRILYAMDELKMNHNSPYKKSARLVGEVLGKYHPHGDIAVYNSMVRMAQDFNTRYMLVDGHGNFGSIDGDSAAAMRYTEARMSKIAEEMLVDINKDTIDWRKNFDESLDEPTVLPAKLPNLLLNGTTGIAVGMATNIPPHNLGEVADGIVALIDNRDISIDELITHIKGPDFPTGGIIYGKSGIYSAYKTGRGKVRVSARTEIVTDKKGKQSIVITELPYQVNKSNLIKRIGELVKDKVITGISDLADLSNLEGIRIVIDIKRGEEAEIVLNKLLKFTDLQTTFGIIMLALVNNAPKVLNLKEILEKYLEHRYDVITRKTIFDLNKAKDRAHILEGLRKALDHIDEIIKTIRGSKTRALAKESLIEKFAFTEIQADAILDMRLHRLTGLAREEIDAEYEKLMLFITDLEDILAKDERKYVIIKEEVLELKQKYGDVRRTDIENDRFEINIEDLIKNEDVIVTITKRGYAKRMSLDSYKSQKRGGKGVSNTTTIEDDVLKDLFTAKTLDTLMVFSDKGKVYSIKVYEIPEVSKQARGKLIGNIIELDENEKISVIIPVDEIENDNRDLIFITRNGIAKKTKIAEFKTINRNGKIAISFKGDEDEVKFVGITSGSEKDEIFISTKGGMAVRFKEEDIRSMGRTAAGVRAIKLNEGDEVVSADVIYTDNNVEQMSVLSVTSLGIGKKTYLSEYNTIKRGGKGVKNYNLERRSKEESENHFVVYSTIIDPSDENSENMELVAISTTGTVIRIKIKDLPVVGRNSKGVKIQSLKYKEYLVSADRVAAETTDEEEIVEE
ncbi:DNA gyrase subunit A [Streptobacillus felis]|uniref:DNA gyrase subunit A n=2 Tax=Streptobacillus felis TaxID=1384509 RepID=A0A7Z0TC49_9FUSO|nr:DNA gyrase subunit A [Streptobacillus felis]